MPKLVNVEDAAADAELRDVFDHRHALEPDRLEMPRQIAQPMRIALAQLEPRRSLERRAGMPRLLEQRARRGEQDVHARRARRARESRPARPPLPCAARLRRIPRAAGTARAARQRPATAGRRATALPQALPAPHDEKRSGKRRASAATSTAADDPGSPLTVRRSPAPGSVRSTCSNAGRRSMASSRRGSDTAAG